MKRFELPAPTWAKITKVTPRKEFAGDDRSARLYRESDFPRICQSLIQHLQFVQQAEAQAA